MGSSEQSKQEVQLTEHEVNSFVTSRVHKALIDAIAERIQMTQGLLENTHKNVVVNGQLSYGEPFTLEDYRFMQGSISELRYMENLLNNLK